MAGLHLLLKMLIARVKSRSLCDDEIAPKLLGLLS
jgi:hypothetical protein